MGWGCQGRTVIDYGREVRVGLNQGWDDRVRKEWLVQEWGWSWQRTHYNHCKRLAISFVKAHIIEATCKEFGIDDYKKFPDIDLASYGDSVSDWLQRVVERMTNNIINAYKLDNPMDHENCDKASF